MYLTDTMLGHGYAVGANIMYAVWSDLFLSAYASMAASNGGLAMSNGSTLASGLPAFDLGGSLGYYFSDTFFFELGIHQVGATGSNTGLGISLGSSYRF